MGLWQRLAWGFAGVGLLDLLLHRRLTITLSDVLTYWILGPAIVLGLLMMFVAGLIVWHIPDFIEDARRERQQRRERP